jgi:hypothetical protein
VWRDSVPGTDQWREPAAGPSAGGDIRLIGDLLAELAPYAYEAGLTPAEVRGATFRELEGVLVAHRRRQARELDGMAWVVAHLLVGGGTLAKGTRVDRLMRSLLGREPGTVPGEATAPAAEPAAMTATETATFLKVWVDAHRPRPRGA